MNNIEIKEQELINSITESDAYIKYTEAKKVLDDSTYLKELIEGIKSIQKELVKAEKKGDVDLIKQKQEELERCNNELNENPIYVNYKNRVDELNNILLVIKQNLDSYFSKKIN